MADYRLNCCGGFPSCVCDERKRKEQERQELAAKGYREVAQPWASRPLGYECQICGALTRNMDKHTEWHQAMRSLC